MALLDVATAGLLLVGIVLAVPVAVLLVEIVSALAFSSPQRRRGDAKPRLAVLVPAHDEALVITETLLNIRDQLSPAIVCWLLPTTAPTQPPRSPKISAPKSSGARTPHGAARATPSISASATSPRTLPTWSSS